MSTIGVREFISIAILLCHLYFYISPQRYVNVTRLSTANRSRVSIRRRPCIFFNPAT